MNPLEWIFDPLPPSGAIQGGVPIAHVLGPDMGIDKFVREVLQNSLDQAAPGEIVRVNFGFHQLDGPEKKPILGCYRIEPAEASSEGCGRRSRCDEITAGAGA